MARPKQMTSFEDCNGRPIPYKTRIRFTWWATLADGLQHEIIFLAEFRKGKRGDFILFTHQEYHEAEGLYMRVNFRRRVEDLTFTPDDLEIVDLPNPKCAFGWAE